MAGSPHAVYETVAYLALSIRTFQQLYPSSVHRLSVFVDDVSLQVVHDTEEECVQAFVDSGSWVYAEFQDTLGLPIEKGKTFLLGSTESVVRRGTLAMGALAGASGNEVRKLGATYSLQHRQGKGRRTVKARQTRDRIAKALARHRRIAGLAGPRTFGTVFQTGLLQEAAFGAELALMRPSDLDKLRVAAVKAHGMSSMGVSHRISLLAR
jgi:hypothetical protein